jgi:cytochrome bd-type quinol oxidase subunit 1
MVSEPDDDIAETLVEGDSYDQAALSVSRMVPLSLDTKIRIAVASLALSVVVAPAVVLRRDLLRSLEGTDSLSLTLGLLVLNGILTTALGGFLLVRQRYMISQGSLSQQQARKQVRIEDFFVSFVLLGALFIVVPAAMLLVGVLSPSAVETLYDNGINIYVPEEALDVDVRLVSALGGTLAVALFGLWRAVR